MATTFAPDIPEEEFGQIAELLPISKNYADFVHAERQRDKQPPGGGIIVRVPITGRRVKMWIAEGGERSSLTLKRIAETDGPDHQMRLITGGSGRA